MSRKKLRSQEEERSETECSSKKSINIVLPVIRNSKIWGWTWEQEMASCLYGTHVPVQLTDSTPTYPFLEKCQRGEGYHSEVEIDIHGTPLGPLLSGRGGALLLHGGSSASPRLDDKGPRGVP